MVLGLLIVGLLIVLEPCMVLPLAGCADGQLAAGRCGMGSAFTAAEVARTVEARPKLKQSVFQFMNSPRGMLSEGAENFNGGSTVERYCKGYGAISSARKALYQPLLISTVTTQNEKHLSKTLNLWG